MKNILLFKNGLKMRPRGTKKARAPATKPTPSLDASFLAELERSIQLLCMAIDRVFPESTNDDMLDTYCHFGDVTFPVVVFVVILGPSTD
ncbi:MAG TPA: hypothetical protein DGL70_10310 [Exiguobacterium sp.]|nr:hypothetical protein [Exiguobacterium sp.]